MGGSSKGDVAWNKYKDLRSRLDLSISARTSGTSMSAVNTPVSRYAPSTAYWGTSLRAIRFPTLPPAVLTPTPRRSTPRRSTGRDELAFTAGLRYDQFSGRLDLPGQPAETQHRPESPLLREHGIKGATFVASYGVFRQPPDYQYLVDAAFDDTVRTGRFRQGNPNLGFEENTQYEFSLRVRLPDHLRSGESLHQAP
jgi:outer membrane receptor protein involved in Fe transport